MGLLLSQIAEKTASRLQGDDVLIDNVADIAHAKDGQLAFYNNARYLQALKNTGASAVVLGEEARAHCPVSMLLTDNPRLVFARAAALLNPPPARRPGIAASAVIDPSATLHESVSIGENAVIGAHCTLAEEVAVGAGCVLAEGVTIGKGTVIHANVTIQRDCTVGEQCIVHSGVVIGTDGFGFIRDGEGYFKVPQLGRVVIGNGVDIGANTTIDRGALLDTVIADGVKLDNQIQVAHNVEIGRNTVISAMTGVAGTTKIGRNCLIGGGVGIRDNIELADDVVVTGRTFVSSSLKQAGVYSSSVLVDTTRNWKKNVMRFKQLDQLAKRLKKIEQRLLPQGPGQVEVSDQDDNR